MEESDLLKERLQAITEKHRIQEDIRQKKLELDQEKLRLQHLKKKALREQWLLQDSTSHNASVSPRQQSLRSDQQQARELQLTIHRIEMEVEALEQEESMISTNESVILSRLKAVEKSPEEIIKEAQENFVFEPAHVAKEFAIDSPSPPVNNHTEPNTSRKSGLLVSKNLLTGESTVLSTAPVSPEEAHPHDRVKESHDQTCFSELSPNEVEHLLRWATVHRQVNYQHNPSRRETHCFYSSPDERDRTEECELRDQGGCHGNYIHCKGTDLSCRENWQRKPQEEQHYDHQGAHYIWQEERHNQSNMREGNHFVNNGGVAFHHGNRPFSSYQVRDCYSVQEQQHIVHHSNSFMRNNSRVNGARANGCVPPRMHDQDAVSAYQPQLCYTPANYIPLSDYITVGDEELHCYSPLSYRPTILYSGPTPPDRVPSPLYGDDTPYTILNHTETTEPITAIFMGFQTAQDDRSQECEGSLKAELVVLDDCEENDEERRSHTGANKFSKGSAANGGLDCVEGHRDRQTDKQVRPGLKKIQKKHKPCCTVC
ncbi:hypothetical protein INR49_001718 [Caranx melampygus]|nr:hypothetical protein INR49_001718 [Caranx melampygus]